MSNVIRVSKAAAVRFGFIALLLPGWCLTGFGADSTPATVTVMTRNVDAGTDLGYLFAGTDENSFAQGMAATLAELGASNFQQRAARLAAEIGAAMPDLIALQEVTLWRTGPFMQPPATNTLYDQLDQILTELGKRNLHYGVIAVQSELDAEAPVLTAGIDLRITDRDVILARLDLPQSQFDLFNAPWPLFGEDQNSGPTDPNERIDLIFAGGTLQRWFGHTPAIVTADRTGTTPPFASDHAGLVVKLRLK